ncbi:MAG: pyridoxal-dependent decarboxylase [Pseudomonadota bacterium]
MEQIADQLPETGQNEADVIALFKDLIESRSALLSAEDAFAHMDPLPPRVAAEVTALNARFNQNLLHPDLSPFATEAEARVIDWLKPFFGMTCGHMCGGSTLANLTALWAAREAGAARVVTSADAHISVPKAAHILGLPLTHIPTAVDGRIDTALWPNLDGAAVVLTAGTTGRGVIDPMQDDILKEASWLHVDAAWAGPLRLTSYASRLEGIEKADSVALSAHKWFFQPKDSAVIMFRDEKSQNAISFGSSYLASPNIGVQGSRGAAGVTLLATLMAWGREGIEQRIGTCLESADALADRLEADERTVLRQRPETAVVNWRPQKQSVEELSPLLTGVCSTVKIGGELWFRNVAANPHVNVGAVWQRISGALNG